jgi:hypothetical protein
MFIEIYGRRDVTILRMVNVSEYPSRHWLRSETEGLTETFGQNTKSRLGCRYRHPKEPGSFERQWQTGIELSFLNGIDRLPGNFELRGQLSLGPILFCTKDL